MRSTDALIFAAVLVPMNLILVYGEPVAESSVERPTLSEASTHTGMTAAAATADPQNQLKVQAQDLRRSKRSLQFDGWFPMDVSNPMADDPTVGYQPPPLERVHFSNEPMPKKPMYPVRTENPPVFVVRAQQNQPEYHRVYGTENVEYFHIEPQTNTVKAFRSPSQVVGAIQFVPAPHFEGKEKGSQHQDTSLRPYTERYAEDFVANAFKKPETYLSSSEGGIYHDIPKKEPGLSDRSDTLDDYAFTSGRFQFSDDPSQFDINYDFDMEGSFSELRPSAVALPNRGSGRQRNAHSYYYNRRRDGTIYVDTDTTRSRRPALYELLGHRNPESQIEESPYLGSASDSVRESFVQEVPPPNFFRRQTSRRQNTHRQPSKNDLRFSSGAPRRRDESDPYDGSPQGTRPWFLIDTRSKHDRKREPSIASYIHPESHSGERVHYKPFGPVTYISKERAPVTSRDHIRNPHLDDHMNSYKPTTSLTANSLSELLQIFRFTHVTDTPDERATDEPVTLVREFRYTRPTEEPPTTIPSSIFASGYRYTPSPSKFETATTETTATEKPKGSYNDDVADTNSLDGYLFSDSEASPEYAHPQVHPNVVIIRPKDRNNSKSIVKDPVRVTAITPSNANASNSTWQEKPTIPEQLVPKSEDFEIIYPGPSRRGATSTSWPLYIIHQGHSKVKMFGPNSAEDKSSANRDFADIYILSTTELATPGSISTTTPSTTITASPTSSPTNSTTNVPPDTSTSSASPPETTTVGSTISSTPLHVTEISTNASTLHATPSSSDLTTYDLIPVEDDKFEYYYYKDNGDIPELDFGDDYRLDSWVRPSLKLPRPPLPEGRQSDFPSVLPIVPSKRDVDPQSSASSFSHVFQERLPPLAPRVPVSDDRVPLSPSMALSRDQLSVARPVFFTKRHTETEDKDSSLSNPFEYLSQLRQIETEQRQPVQDNTNTQKARPTPRMKRITDASLDA